MENQLNVFIKGEAENNSTSGFGSPLADVLYKLSPDDSETTTTKLLDCGRHQFNNALTNQINGLNNQIRRKLANSGDKLTLNLYGYSRGAAGVLLLCKQLRDLPRSKLTINASALEPVPGNYLNTTGLEQHMGAKTTLASQISDLSDCDNINRLQLLIMNEQGPNNGTEAPVMPVLPKQANYLQIEALPGSSANIQSFFLREDNQLSPLATASAITFHHVMVFLQRSGIEFQLARLSLDNELICANEQLKLSEEGRQKVIDLYQRFLPLDISLSNNRHSLFKGLSAQAIDSSRKMHFGNCVRTLNPNEIKVQYVNSYHKTLSLRAPASQNQCLMIIDHRNPQHNQYHTSLMSRLKIGGRLLSYLSACAHSQQQPPQRQQAPAKPDNNTEILDNTDSARPGKNF